MKTESKSAAGSPAIRGLVSSGPNPELKGKLSIFGDYKGDWSIEEKSYLADGTTRTRKGEMHLGWILDGNAVQDVWGSLEGNPPKLVTWGTTIRFYDPKLDAWPCIWIGPRSGTIRTFIARKVGAEVVLEGIDENGNPDRWIWFDLKPDSFRWRSEESTDQGKTWRINQEMWLNRISS